MSTPAPRLVIFVCDGVLIDSEIIAPRPQSRALAEHGMAKLAPAMGFTARPVTRDRPLP